MKKIILMIIATIVVAVSCKKSDDGAQPVNPHDNPNGISVQVELRSQALQRAGKAVADNKPSAESSESTESKSTAELDPIADRAMHNLWAIQFGSDKAIIGSYYTDIIPKSTVVGSDISYPFSVDLKTNSDTEGKVYFIANVGADFFTTSQLNGMTITTLEGLSKTFGTEYKPATETGLPMLGVYTGRVLSGVAIKDVVIKRLIAKVVLRWKSS